MNAESATSQPDVTVAAPVEPPELSLDHIRAAYWHRTPVSREQVEILVRSMDTSLAVRERRQRKAVIYGVVAVLLAWLGPPLVGALLLPWWNSTWYPLVVIGTFPLFAANLLVAAIVIAPYYARHGGGVVNQQIMSDAIAVKWFTDTLGPQEREALLELVGGGRCPYYSKYVGAMQSIIDRESAHHGAPLT